MFNEVLVALVPTLVPPKSVTGREGARFQGEEEEERFEKFDKARNRDVFSTNTFETIGSDLHLLISRYVKSRDQNRQVSINNKISYLYTNRLPFILRENLIFDGNLKRGKKKYF